MVVLKDGLVGIANGKRVFSPYYKLIAVARMFEVVHQTCKKNSKMVLLLQELFHVSNFEHVVQALQTVKDVYNVMVGVFFEVTKSHFSSEAHQRFQFDVCVLVKVVELEEFINHELQTVVVKNLVEVECVEGRQVNTFK